MISCIVRRRIPNTHQTAGHLFCAAVRDLQEESILVLRSVMLPISVHNVLHRSPIASQPLLLAPKDASRCPALCALD